MAHRNRRFSQLETSIDSRFSMAMLNNQMVNEIEIESWTWNCAWTILEGPDLSSALQRVFKVLLIDHAWPKNKSSKLSNHIRYITSSISDTLKKWRTSKKAPEKSRVSQLNPGLIQFLDPSSLKRMDVFCHGPFIVSTLSSKTCSPQYTSGRNSEHRNHRNSRLLCGWEIFPTRHHVSMKMSNNSTIGLRGCGQP